MVSRIGAGAMPALMFISVVMVAVLSIVPETSAFIFQQPTGTPLTRQTSSSAVTSTTTTTKTASGTTVALTLRQRQERQQRCRHHDSSLVGPLFMGKGLNRANKQADLRRKMELAKQQNRENAGTKQEKKKYELSDDEIKERNDRLRFEELLKGSTSSAFSDYSSDGYQNKAQEEQDSILQREGVTDRLFEGDPAPTDCFQELVSIKSENAIGEAGAARMVPWLRKNPDRRADYLVIITDPRKNSPELRQTIKRLEVDMADSILDRMIVVNADTPAENRRWMKKNNAFKIDVYSDEKMEWLQQYTALGKDRWSMSLFVVADERVVKIAREVDGFQAVRVVTNALKGLV